MKQVSAGCPLPVEYLMIRKIGVILLLVSATTASAQSLQNTPSIAAMDPPRGLVDVHHIERNAAYSVFALAWFFNDNIIGYFSWDTDDDGIIGGLLVKDLNEQFNVIGALTYNDKKAGNHTVMGFAHLNYNFPNGYVGAGLALEKGTDSDVANTIGKQDTLTYRLLAGYTFANIETEFIYEDYDYRNDTYRALNSTISDKNTSTAGLSAFTVEGAYLGLERIEPYVLLKFKEFEGSGSDDEVRIGFRWMF